MSNIYYTYSSGQPVAISRGASSLIRAEFALISQGFDSVSNAINGKGAITGQNWSGIHDYTAGTIKVPTLPVGSSGTFAASVDYVNQQAYSAALPGQTGNADKLVTTDGATTPSASFTDKLNVSVLKFVDGTDKTKQVQVIASGLTTNTTRKVYMPDRDVTLGGFSNLVVILSTQTWTPPAGVTKAKFTVIDGGQGGGTSTTTDYAYAGKGGDASVSIRAVSPTTTYTITVGAGGVGNPASNVGAGSVGGASSVSGAGFTTLTSANGDITVTGGPALTIGNAQSGGSTLLANNLAFNAASATGIGQGGPGVTANGVSKAGGAGGVIIEY
jgi:hypothetical protein